MSNQAEGNDTRRLQQRGRLNATSLDSDEVRVGMAEYIPPQQKLYFVFDLYEVSDTPPPPKRSSSFTDAVCQVIGTTQRHQQFVEGVLLKSTEQNSIYPYISFSIFDIRRHGRFIPEPNIAKVTREAHGADQRLDHGDFEELYTVCDHDLNLHKRSPANPNTAYIVSAFKTINPDLKEIEKRWTVWSGADFILSYAPLEICLKRLSFYRRLGNSGTFTYLLLCECSQALTDMARTMEFVDNIRTRKCGYTGVYKVEHGF